MMGSSELTPPSRDRRMFPMPSSGECRIIRVNDYVMCALVMRQLRVSEYSIHRGSLCRSLLQADWYKLACMYPHALTVTLWMIR